MASRQAHRRSFLRVDEAKEAATSINVPASFLPITPLLSGRDVDLTLWPARHHATINGQDGAGNPIGLITGKKEDRCHDVVRLSIASQRMEGVKSWKDVGHLFLSEEGVEHRRLDDSWRDGVDTDLILFVGGCLQDVSASSIENHKSSTLEKSLSNGLAHACATSGDGDDFV